MPPPFSCAIGLIADGVHVHDASLRAAHCCAGERVSLVTDAVAAAGLEDGDHFIAGQSITVTGGRAVVTSTGVLVRP
jgi:N-acetylglucosamine-6-phosphate deacetylase